MKEFISKRPPQRRTRVRRGSRNEQRQPVSKWKSQRCPYARTTSGRKVFSDAGRKEAQARQLPKRSQAMRRTPTGKGGSAEFPRKTFAHVRLAPPVETREEAAGV